MPKVTVLPAETTKLLSETLANSHLATKPTTLLPNKDNATNVLSTKLPIQTEPRDATNKDASQLNTWQFKELANNVSSSQPTPRETHLGCKPPTESLANRDNAHKDNTWTQEPPLAKLAHHTWDLREIDATAQFVEPEAELHRTVNALLVTLTPPQLETTSNSANLKLVTLPPNTLLPTVNATHAKPVKSQIQLPTSETTVSPEPVSQLSILTNKVLALFATSDTLWEMIDVDATRLLAMQDKSLLKAKIKLVASHAQLIPNLKLNKPTARLTHAIKQEVLLMLMVPAHNAHNTRWLLPIQTVPRDVPCHNAQAWDTQFLLPVSVLHAVLTLPLCKETNMELVLSQFADQECMLLNKLNACNAQNKPIFPQIEDNAWDQFAQDQSLMMEDAMSAQNIPDGTHRPNSAKRLCALQETSSLLMDHANNATHTNQSPKMEEPVFHANAPLDPSVTLMVPVPLAHNTQHWEPTDQMLTESAIEECAQLTLSSKPTEPVPPVNHALLLIELEEPVLDQHAHQDLSSNPMENVLLAKTTNTLIPRWPSMFAVKVSADQEFVHSDKSLPEWENAKIAPNGPDQMSKTEFAFQLTAQKSTKSRPLMACAPPAQCSTDQTARELSAWSQTVDLIKSWWRTEVARNALNTTDQTLKNSHAFKTLVAQDKCWPWLVNAKPVTTVKSLFLVELCARLQNVETTKSWTDKVCAESAHHNSDHLVTLAVPNASKINAMINLFLTPMEDVFHAQPTPENNKETFVAQTSANKEKDWLKMELVSNAQIIPEEMEFCNNNNSLNAIQILALRTKSFKKMVPANIVPHTLRLMLRTRTARCQLVWQTERSWDKMPLGRNAQHTPELTVNAESADQTHAHWDKNWCQMVLVPTVEITSPPLLMEDHARDLPASTDKSWEQMEPLKIAHHTLTELTTAWLVWSQLATTERDSWLKASVRNARSTPDHSTMENNAAQIFAPREKLSKKTVPACNVETTEEPCGMERSVVHWSAMLDKSFRSMEPVLTATHSPELPRMERLVSQLNVTTDKNFLLMANAWTAQHTPELKETEPNAAQTAATSDKLSWRTEPASTANSTRESPSVAQVEEPAARPVSAHQMRCSTRTVPAKNALLMSKSVLTEETASLIQMRSNLIQSQLQRLNSRVSWINHAAQLPVAMSGKINKCWARIKPQASTWTQPLELSHSSWEPSEPQPLLPLFSPLSSLQWMLFEWTMKFN